MQNEESLRLERLEPGIATLTQCRRGGPNVISVDFCERLLRCTEINSGRPPTWA
jgi:hypothetical protein